MIEKPGDGGQVWACNDDQTVFCCDTSSPGDLTERSCCGGDSLVTLAAPTLLPTPSPSSFTVGVKVGAAIGVALGALFFRVLGWRLWGRRKHQTERESEGTHRVVAETPAIEQ